MPSLHQHRPSRLRTEGNCSICLNPKLSDPAAISCCKHTFHLHCIKAWSQITNKCPFCKLRFKYITSLHTHELISVENREQKLQRDDLTYDVLENDSYWDCIPCQECKSTDRSNDHLAIICDSCENVYHTFCIGLGDNVPQEDHWFCPKCYTVLFGTKKTEDKDTSVIYYDDLSDFDMNEELPDDRFSKHLQDEHDDEWVPRNYSSSNVIINDFGTMKREEKQRKSKRKQRKRKRALDLNDDTAKDINDAVFALKRRKIGIIDEEDKGHNDPLDAAYYGYTMNNEGVECIEDRMGERMWSFTFERMKKKKNK